MENAILKEVVDKVKITPKSGLLPNKISTRLFVLIAITVMAFVGFGETTYTETVDGVEYSYTILSGKAIITSAKVGDKTVLQIPSSLGGYDVTSIGSWTFDGCTRLTSVTIPMGVASIGDHAFDWCSGLASVTICDGVKSIGSYAFSGCSGLTSLIIPSSVTNIGRSAFYECSGLTAVTIPNSVTSIEYAAFEGCVALASVTIPNSVTSIRRRAFINCSNLTSVVIPSSVKSIGMEAFRGCSELASVTIPSSVTSVGDYAFMDCRGLTSVSIHEGVKSIGSYAFGFCGALMSVTIPSSVTSIGDYAFYWCECLASVTIPGGVTYVGEGALEGCGEAICNETINDVEYSYTISSSKATITNAKVGGKAVVRIPSSLGGCEVTSIGYEAFSGCSGLESVMIPQGVTRIDEYAFFDCSGLTSVTIPEGVTSIGSRAFSGCGGLTSAVIPSSVSSIGDGAFEDCSGLKSITVDPMSRNYCSINGLLCSKDGKTLIQGANGDVNIPEGVTSIGARTFSGCSRLTSVSIPSSVTSIGSYAFNNCSGLTSVVIPSGVTSVGSYAFSGCSRLTSVSIPSSVKSIGLYAFNNCSGLTSVTMPSCVSRLSSIFPSAYDKIREVVIDEGVTSIESQAFFGCGNLTSVTIPLTVTSIGDYAFSGCRGLTSVIIPSGVTRIGIAAFYDCRELTSLIIPLSVTSVGARAFFGCCGLQSVSIPSSVKSISDYVFCGCSGLTSVTIPLGVTRIGEYAFSDCSGLASVTIPSSVTGIGAYAFSGCSGLTTVTMPSCVRSLSQIFTSAYNKIHEVIICEGTTSIGRNMFDGCEGVTSVRIPSTVTDIDDQAFYYCGGLTSFSVTSDNPSYKSISGLLCSKDGCQVVCGVNGDISIPPGVLNIGDYAFAGHDGLTSVVIPESVTSIGNAAFVNCRALKSVKIPLSVRNIGHYAFSGCYDLWLQFMGAPPECDYDCFLDCGAGTYVNCRNEWEGVIDEGCWQDLEMHYAGMDAKDAASNVSVITESEHAWQNVLGAVVVGTGANQMTYQSVWQSGGIGDDESTVLSATVRGEGWVGFWWKVSCEKYKSLKWDNLEFSIDGVAQEPWINGETDWAYLEFEVVGANEHVLKWTYAKDGEDADGQDCGWVTGIRWVCKLSSLADYLNCDNLEFTTSGDANWQPDLVTAHDGVASLRSGVIGDSQVSRLETVVSGGGTISFWWNASSESYKSALIDKLTFLIDGVEVSAAGSTSATWTKFTKEVIGAGSHTLTWVYSKDESDAQGGDCGWLDEVSWTPLQQGVVVPSEITGGKEVVVDESWPASLDAQFGAGTSAAFVEKFGSDLSAALLKSTGKKNAAGEEMYVWQDYVAGTDPTDPASKFTAKIEIVDGEPVVIWSPKLSDAEAAKRIYTTYGKKTLEGSHGGEPCTIEPWTPVETPAQGGWRFFKVGVEMR